MLEIKTTLARLTQAFRKPVPDYSEETALLLDSKKFDPDFYLSAYPDIAQDPYWREHALEHFIKHGNQESRNPNNWFDSSWYLEKYPDVKNAGLAPFIHYLKYGQAEQRQTKKNPYGPVLEAMRRKQVKHLWGGHSEAALSDLQEIGQEPTQPDEVRFFALWQCARWYYFVETYDKALEMADTACAISEEFRLRKIIVMIYACCFLAQGKTAEAKAVIKEFLEICPADSDMLLMLSNTLDEDEDRIETINQVYRNHGLATIRRRDDSLPLSMSNLTSDVNSRESGPKVSVIIPVYNSAETLSIAIQSLLEQSWKHLEIIVVDDCSPDNTFEVAKSFSKQDARVKAIQHEKNGGAYQARNTGLGHATGDFITTHDGDDWSHPQKIEIQVTYLQENPERMGICTHWVRSLPNLRFTQNWRLNTEVVHWSHSSFLFRRSVIDDIGPWDNVMVGGDTEFLWRIESKYGAQSVKKLHRTIPLAFALDDEGSLTRTKATHVKTIHNGIRHIYRECASWWHRTQKENLRLGNGNLARPFSAPATMLDRTATEVECDTLYVSDFSYPEINRKILLLIEQSLECGERIALYHWPFYGRTVEALQNSYFESLAYPTSQPVVYGQTVHAERVIVSDPSLLNHLVEQRPRVNANEGIVLDNGNVERQPEMSQRVSAVFKTAFNLTPRFSRVRISLEHEIDQQQDSLSFTGQEKEEKSPMV